MDKNELKIKELEIKLNGEIQRSETYKFFTFAFMSLVAGNLVFYNFGLKYFSIFLNILGFILLLFGAFYFLKIEKIMVKLNELKENEESEKKEIPKEIEEEDDDEEEED